MSKKKIDTQFFMLLFISLIIIIGIFAAASPKTTGYATSERKVTAWHCGFYNAPPKDIKGMWRWVSWPDAEVRLTKTIHAKDAGCVKGEWVCPYSVCGDGKKVKDCYCIE